MAKIGRNDTCPCGSGKKYKKCCLDKNDALYPNYDKRYFELKGKDAENFVYELAQKSFLTDWCYPNPKWEDGTELCDLLIVFGETVIIWQVKNLKRQENGHYNKGEVDKNLRQLMGAKRRLFDLNDKMILKNPRRGNEEFDPKKIKEIYLVSALVGDGEHYFEFVKKIKDKIVHVLDKNAMEIILNELDTVKDFIDYIKEKERFMSSETKVNILGGEEEFLAYYLMNERSFKKMESADFSFIEEGCWAELTKRKDYLAKKKEDTISYLWDFLIDKAHLSNDPNYEIVAREMATTSRFKRRYLSKAFIDAMQTSAEIVDKNYFHRIVQEEGKTFCFVFIKNVYSQEHRKNLLGSVCLVARDKFRENHRVLGISTEMQGIEHFHSFEFCLLDFLEWTKLEEEQAKKLSETIGIFNNPRIGFLHEDEYPKEVK